jgi:hypothetical protein
VTSLKENRAVADEGKKEKGAPIVKNGFWRI